MAAPQVNQVRRGLCGEKSTSDGESRKKKDEGVMRCRVLFFLLP